MKSQLYMACEIVKAEPMTELQFVKNVKKEYPDKLQKLLLSGDGYKVSYSDNMITWVEKSFFEAFFRKITPDETNFIVKNIIDTNDRESV